MQMHIRQSLTEMRMWAQAIARDAGGRCVAGRFLKHACGAAAAAVLVPGNFPGDVALAWRGFYIQFLHRL